MKSVKPSTISPAATCSPPAGGGIEWQKQPGASDADLAAAKTMWEDAKGRRLPDGSKPDTVKAMEALECSDKKTVIKVGANGNSAKPDNWGDAKDPTKGSSSTIEFNPNKKGAYGDGVKRDPESSLAHEAYHSYEISRGELSHTDMKKNAEVNASSAENQHRKAKGLKQRDKYGSWDIPKH